MDNQSAALMRALESGAGVLRLSPAWVPRDFCIPGRRIKLHPDDYYAYGAHRGGIDERWFASTTKADNGPETNDDEGLSYICVIDGARQTRVLLKDAIDDIGNEILGPEIMQRHGGWMMFSKFFDNLEPLPLHLHQNDEFAERVGQRGKPESYYFPPQLNNHGGTFPHTFFGLNPGVKRGQLADCLRSWTRGDNNVLHLSRAYKLKLGTGWDVPAGTLHAPGSLLTYEPQRASDVFAMYQNIASDKYLPRDLLTKNVPERHKLDIDYLVDMVDWDLNADPDFFEHHFLAPRPVKPREEMQDLGYQETWVVYGCDAYSAKELTVAPGRTVTIEDEGPYGAIVVQGRGRFGPLEVEAPTSIRFGEMTADELFVCNAAARAGVVITNTSAAESLVILKHFGPAG